MKIQRFFLLTVLCAAITACGQSTSEDVSFPSLNDDGSTTEISGSVPTKSASAGSGKALGASASCEADTVVAVDPQDRETRADIESDCSFRVNVKRGTFYRFRFEYRSEHVATLQFSNGSFYFRSYVYISFSSELIDLREVSFSNEVALAREDIFEQIDCDDDHDGISDLLEEDCDLDGIPDDWDPQAGCDSDGDNGLFARVLEVQPRHDPDGDEPVELEKKVRARVNCKVDDDLLTDATFRVQSDDGTHWVDCKFTLRYNEEKDESKIICKHNDDPFLPDTFYSAKIAGLLCEDKTIVETKSWTWLTEEEEEEPGEDPEEDPLLDPEVPDPELPETPNLEDEVGEVLSVLDQIEEGVCDRVIDADFYDVLHVKKGQECTIEAGVHIYTDIDVDVAGLLRVKGRAKIDGDINSEDGASVTIDPTATITGKITGDVTYDDLL